METGHDNPGPHQVERRTQPELRKVFDAAAKRLHHFFHNQDDWAGSSQDFLALRIVHEGYPELTSSQVRTLVSAISRRVQPPGMTNSLCA